MDENMDKLKLYVYSTMMYDDDYNDAWTLNQTNKLIVQITHAFTFFLLHDSNRESRLFGFRCMDENLV